MKHLLTLALIISAAAPLNAAPLYGDVNGDLAVTPADAAIILRCAAGLSSPTAMVRHLGDVAPVTNYDGGIFGDGKIGFDDAMAVIRKSANLASPNWPVTPNYYIMEVGNFYTMRKYDATGAATTGPGTGVSDVLTTVDRTQSEVVGGLTYTAFVIISSNGDEQHFASMKYKNDTTGTLENAVGLLSGTVGGQAMSFNPPLVGIVSPVQAGTKWSGKTISSVLGSVTYTGELTGPEPISTPGGDFAACIKATMKYSFKVLIFPGSGIEYFWYAPFVGPVQHGFTRSVPGQPVETVIPDAKLATANLHGVLYP